MIIVNIKEGLGNQLFQYASAKRLSIKRGTQLKLLPSFADDKKRSFKLSFFNIEDNLATNDDLQNVIKNKLIRAIQRFKPYYRRNYYRERMWVNDLGLLNASNEVFLDGFWANPLFFSDIRDEIINIFSLKKKFENDAFLNFKKTIIKDRCSVSIHIRRGDYAKDKGVNDFFGTIDLKYYIDAQKLILKKHENPTFYVFSDNIDWVVDNVKLLGNVVYSNSTNLEDYHELVLMSTCKHNIIANSTFSWWGAWLNINNSKMVIAPEVWYKNKKAQKFYEDHPFVPETWIKL